jgi:hypothetical protein
MKTFNRIYDLSNVFSGIDLTWWRNNDEIPNKYEIKSFTVKSKNWEEWKNANLSKPIDRIYSVKTNDQQKDLYPKRATYVHIDCRNYEVLINYKENRISKDIVEINDMDVWWSNSSNFLIEEFHKSIIDVRVSSTEKSSVYMVVMNQGSLDLKSFDIIAPEIDIKMNYGDEWAIKHDHLVESLTVNHKKGIALLHGLPGTGKSMYIRHLISLLSENRTMIYLPNQMIDSITDPAFIPLMADYPNSILIIEDADEAIKSRKVGGRAVDKLLNLADGILSDFLGTQIICTFNSDITTIDEALLRKGRLILKHKFGKLPREQAQRLSDNLGFKTIIDSDMTLAEIYNQEDVFGGQTDSSAKIGF